jgi:endonuclease YncB( thermonuclease family)
MKLLSFFALFISFNTFAGMTLPIVRIYDGDTIISYMPLPEKLSKVSIRVYGIDTPESPAKSYKSTGKLGRAKCRKEADMALQATSVVEGIAKGADYMIVEDYKWGKFGGRIVGKVTINGVDIADELIQQNLAVPYFGKKKSKDWCK